MKLKTWTYTCLLALLCLTSCSEEYTPSEGGKDPQKGSGSAVLLLGKSPNNADQGALAYLSPDGVLEEDVWQQANGTTLVSNVRDLFVCQNKLYILCSTDGNGTTTDGGLIVADATTFKKEKSFSLSDLAFEKPEGTGPEYRPYLKTPTSLAVINERNVFIKDAQGLFRFDTTTGVLTAIEGTYHIANTIGGDGNLESKVSSKGLIVANGKLYLGSAGFWSDQSGIMEITPDKNKISRTLEFPVDLVSGLVKGKDNELLLTHYVRGTKRSNEVTRVSLDDFQTDETVVKPTTISLAPGFFDKSGVVYDGNQYLYLSEIEETETKVNYLMTLNRINLSDGTSEKLADFKTEVPNAKYLTTTPAMDAQTQYVYISVADNMFEGQASNTSLLIYDCSGEKPVLKQKLSGKTSRTVGIYFIHTRE